MEDFKAQRRAGMIAIALAAPVAVALWIGLDRFLPPISGMADLSARMLFCLKCWCVAVLFALAMGIEAVAHERLVSAAFDPLAGFTTRRLQVNQQYLQNTLEQTAQRARQCVRSRQRRWSGCLRAGPFGLAITAVQPCAALALPVWR